MIDSLTKIELLHCCMTRGVKVKIYLSEAVTLDMLHKLESKNDKIISDMFIYSVGEGGFYRFILCGVATVSGVLQESALTVLYTFFHSSKIIKQMDLLFPGFEEEFCEARGII
jgi:hypothetical protein